MHLKHIMNRNNFFSIIIITKSNYNDLLLTLGSVLEIEYQNYEVIVVNGSHHEYVVPASYRNNCSITEIHDDGLGIYNAMNLGIDHVNGDFVVFMNSGDQFASPAVLADVNLMLRENEDTDVLYGASLRVDRDSGRSSKFVPRRTESLLYGMISCHQSIYYRSSLLFEHKFDVSNRISNDWKHLLNLYQMGYKFLMTDRVLSVFDISGVSSKRYLKYIIERWKYARKISVNRAHVDSVYFRKIVKVIRWKLKNRFRGV